MTATWTPPGGGTGISLEDARDAVGAIITSGAGISAVYDDAGDGGAGTITITALLSDTNPRSVTASANAPGTSVSAARRDHHHQVAAATTTQAGIVELATNAESLDITEASRATVPRGVHHIIDNRGSDNNPEAPGTAVSGTSTDFARSDHVHPEGTGGGADLSDTAPVDPSIASASAGTADEAARQDHRHRIQTATETRYGLVRLATNAEALAGTSTSKVINPSGLQHKLDNTTVAGGVTIQDSGVQEGTGIGTINFGDSLEVEVTGGVALVHGDAGSGAGVTLSDDQPVNIGPQGQQGSGDEASRDDHTHYLPHDTTLAFSAGTLGVNISDVVEHLSQNVRYYTQDGTNYSTDGSAAGQVYNTSRFPKSLQWVKASLRPPQGVDDAIYRAGAYIVDATRNITAILGQSAESGIITGTRTHRFDFLATDTSALGIPLEGGERIMVLIRRVGAGNTAETGLIHGSEAGDSPDESYPDAGLTGYSPTTSSWRTRTPMWAKGRQATAPTFVATCSLATPSPSTTGRWSGIPRTLVSTTSIAARRPTDR